MIKEVELKKPDLPRPLYWMSYSFIFIFIVWLFLLFSDSIFSTKLIIKQDLSSLSDTIIIKEPIVFQLIKPGSAVKSGEAIGIKTDKETWESVNSIEALIKDETDTKNLINKIIGLRSGVNSIDHQTDSLLGDIQEPVRNQEIRYTDKKETRFIKVDNSKKIAQAERELKELQLKYAKKKVNLETLSAASTRLKNLKTEDGNTIPVKHIIKTKLPVTVKEIDKELSNNAKFRITRLLKTISEWKSDQIVKSSLSGNLVYLRMNGKEEYQIISRKNNPVYYVDGNSRKPDDTLKGIIEMPGKNIFPAIAIWDSEYNRYKFVGQETLLNKQYKYNSNARIVFKPTGHSYYSMLKSYLNHK